MVLLAQVDLAEAATYADCGELLPRGLLSLFVEPEALGEQGSWQLMFTESGGELTRLPAPAGVAGQDRLAAVPLTFEREMSWPPPYSAVLGELGLPSSQIAAYERAIDAEGDRPIHRMLGHPALIQPPDPRDADPELCLLMQIDSDDAAGWQWGDVGCIYVWIRRADLAAHRFDRALLNVQSA